MLRKVRFTGLALMSVVFAGGFHPAPAERDGGLRLEETLEPLKGDIPPQTFDDLWSAWRK